MEPMRKSALLAALLGLFGGAAAEDKYMVVEAPSLNFLFKRGAATSTGVKDWIANKLGPLEESATLTAYNNRYAPTEMWLHPKADRSFAHRYGLVRRWPMSSTQLYPDFTTFEGVKPEWSGHIYNVRTTLEVRCRPPLDKMPNTKWTQMIKSRVETIGGVEELISGERGSFTRCMWDAFGRKAANGDSFFGFALKSDGCYGYTGWPYLVADDRNGGHACILPNPKPCHVVLESQSTNLLLKKVPNISGVDQFWQGDSVNATLGPSAASSSDAMLWPLIVKEIPTGTKKASSYGSAKNVITRGGCVKEQANAFNFTSAGRANEMASLYVPQTAVETSCRPKIVKDGKDNFVRMAKTVVHPAAGVEEKIGAEKSLTMCLRNNHAKNATSGDSFYGFAVKADGCYGYTGWPFLKDNDSGGVGCVISNPKPCNVVVEVPDQLYAYFNVTQATYNHHPVWKSETLGPRNRDWLVMSKGGQGRDEWIHANTGLDLPQKGTLVGRTAEILKNNCFTEESRVIVYAGQVAKYGRLYIPRTPIEKICKPPHEVVTGTDGKVGIKLVRSVVNARYGVEERISQTTSFTLCLREGHGKYAKNNEKFYAFAVKRTGCYGYTGWPVLEASEEGGMACVLENPNEMTKTTTPTTTAATTTTMSEKEKMKQCCMQKCVPKRG